MDNHRKMIDSSQTTPIFGRRDAIWYRCLANAEQLFDC
jgi:hypothetical protein